MDAIIYSPYGVTKLIVLQRGKNERYETVGFIEVTSDEKGHSIEIVTKNHIEIVPEH